MAGRPSTKQPTENGARLAAFRRTAGLSQVQLAAQLGIPQRTLSFYEREADSIPSKLLPPLAQTFGVAVEDLLGLKDARQAKRGPKSRLERQLEEVKRLPRGDQQFVSRFLDNVLQKAAG